jgi:ABC-type Fe3+ transport system substrate-binding protein
MSLQDIRNLTSYHVAFAATVAQTPHKRLHRNNLPPLPKSWKQMLKYSYKQGFSNATRIKYGKLGDKNIYEEVEHNSEYLLPLI